MKLARPSLARKPCPLAPPIGGCGECGHGFAVNAGDLRAICGLRAGLPFSGISGGFGSIRLA